MPRREGQRYGRRTKAELLSDGQPQRERGEGTFVPVVIRGEELVRAYKLVRRADGALVKVSGTGKDRAQARARLNANHAAFLIRNASGAPAPGNRAPRAAAAGPGVPTLADLAVEWLDWRKTHITHDGKEKLSVQAANSYRLIIKNHLRPWADLPITDYTADAIRTFAYDTLQERDLSNSHIRTIQGVLFQVFDYAFGVKRLLPTDPTLGMKMLRRNREDRFRRVKAERLDNHMYLPDRILSYLAPGRTAADFDTPDAFAEYQRLSPYEARWAMSAMLALRPAEVAGLTWDRFDYLDDKSGDPGRRPVVMIAQQLARNAEHEQHGTRLYIKENPKTAAGERVLPLHPDLVAMLLRWKRIQARWKKSADWSPHPHLARLVFTTRTGKPLRQQDDSLMWRALVRAAFPGAAADDAVLALRQYSLRHLGITRLLRQQAPGAVVADIAGHHSVMLSMKTYGHLDVGDKVGPLAQLAEHVMRERRDATASPPLAATKRARATS